MNLRPMGARVVVELDDPVKKSAGGIVLPDGCKEVPTTGKVLAVGTGNRVFYPGDGGAFLNDPVDVRVGDKIVFRHDAGIDHKVSPSKTVRIMNESEILAVVEPEDAE